MRLMADMNDGSLNGRGETGMWDFEPFRFAPLREESGWSFRWNGAYTDGASACAFTGSDHKRGARPPRGRRTVSQGCIARASSKGQAGPPLCWLVESIGCALCR
jgi:hypothetical protein